MAGYKMRALMVAGAVAAAFPFVSAVMSATPANAIACGYSQQLEDVPASGFSAAVGPISAPLGGGQRQIGHWGNCSPNRQLIRVDQANGTKPTFCVTPGDTRLGLATGSAAVTGATAIPGPC